MATIILPSSSSSEDLQIAINNAVPGVNNIILPVVEEYPGQEESSYDSRDFDYELDMEADVADEDEYEYGDEAVATQIFAPFSAVPVGTFAALQQAVADEEPLILIENDITFTSAITISHDVKFTATNTVMLTVTENFRHFHIVRNNGGNVTLEFENVELVGRKTSIDDIANPGGGILLIRSVPGPGDVTPDNTLNTLYLINARISNVHGFSNHGGAISFTWPQGEPAWAAGTYGNLVISGSNTLIKNSSFQRGGAISANHITINDGLITGNRGLNRAGAIYAYGGLIMNGGTITDNHAMGPNQFFGGGAILSRFGDVVINGGTISYNTSTTVGGAIQVLNPHSITINNNAIIRDNEAALDGGGLHSVNVSITGGSIRDNTAGGNGGGVHTRQINISGGDISGNTADVNGGGIFSVGGEFTIYDGEINNNTAGERGGGIAGAGTRITIQNGEINNNTALNGGGIFTFSDFVWDGTDWVLANGVVTMQEGSISNNTATDGDGGGVLVWWDSYLTMYGGAISGNEVLHGNGGGIYNLGFTDISGNVEIINNRAADNGNGQGGGIYTDDFNLLTITGPFVRFANNRADFATNRDPVNAAVYATNILNMESNWTVPFTQGYNNYDINQLGPIVNIVTVTYNANGGVSSCVDIVLSGTQYTVLTPEAAGISRSGYIFIGWNTQQDGSGISYMPGETIIIAGNLTLYAQWEPAREEINCCLIILLFLMMKCRPRKKCCCKNL